MNKTLRKLLVIRSTLIILVVVLYGPLIAITIAAGVSDTILSLIKTLIVPCGLISIVALDWRALHTPDNRKPTRTLGISLLVGIITSAAITVYVRELAGLTCTLDPGCLTKTAAEFQAYLLGTTLISGLIGVMLTILPSLYALVVTRSTGPLRKR